MLQEPGSRFAYNDVRINLLARALTRLWRRGLGEVLEQELMGPIGGSGTAQWHGYANSWIEDDGLRIPCVSGGATGVAACGPARVDHARFGQLYLSRGLWDAQRILSEEWIDLSFTPGESNPDYGFLWWLNDARRIFGRAPTTGMCARQPRASAHLDRPRTGPGDRVSLDGPCRAVHRCCLRRPHRRPLTSIKGCATASRRPTRQARSRSPFHDHLMRPTTPAVCGFPCDWGCLATTFTGRTGAVWFSV